MDIKDYDWKRLEGLGFDLGFVEEASNPCWKGYEAVGMKKKGGRKVPNCVPIQKKFSENPIDDAVVAPTLKKHPTKPPSSFMLAENTDKPCGIHTNGGMAISQIKSIMENASVILSLISPESNLDPWMAAKLAEADHGMTAIADYLKYKA